MKSIHLNSTDQLEKQYRDHRKQSQYSNLPLFKVEYMYPFLKQIIHTERVLSGGRKIKTGP